MSLTIHFNLVQCIDYNVFTFRILTNRPSLFATCVCVWCVCVFYFKIEYIQSVFILTKISNRQQKFKESKLHSVMN